MAVWQCGMHGTVFATDFQKNQHASTNITDWFTQLDKPAPKPPRGGYVRQTSSPTIGVYQDALADQKTYEANQSANQSSVDQAEFGAAIQAATPAFTFPPATTPQPPAAPRPAAPVDTRTQAEKETAFYAALQTATDAAKAGDPTQLQNFDKYFKITRNPAEYKQSFYYGSSPNEQIKLINDMPISQEMKTKVIAEKLAIQAGARENDSVDNIIAWFNAGGPPDPRTVTHTNSSAQNRNNLINSTNLSQEMKTKVIAENLAIQAGVREADSVDNIIAWFNAGGPQDPRTAKWASSATPENQIAVVNATNISQDFKNKVIAEIQAGSNLSDTVYDKISWFERGNPPSAAALAILNPPPAPVEPAAPSSGTPLVETAKSSAPESTDSQDTEAGRSDNAGSPNESSENGKPEIAGNSEEHRKDAEAHAKAAAAQADADEKQQQALAVATANKQSAKEARLKKIMEMRKPWTAGAASVQGSSDAMVVPPIVPASQVPPPPIP